MLPKFISLEGRHGWGGACVQQIRSGPEQNTRKHTSWWERLLRDSGWLTAAKLPVGWVLGGDQANTRKHDIRIIHKSPDGSMRTQKWHTQKQSCFHTLKLPPPVRAKPFPFEYLWYLWVEDYFGDAGLLQHTRSGDKILKPVATEEQQHCDSVSRLCWIFIFADDFHGSVALDSRTIFTVKNKTTPHPKQTKTSYIWAGTYLHCYNKWL